MAYCDPGDRLIDPPGPLSGESESQATPAPIFLKKALTVLNTALVIARNLMIPVSTFKKEGRH